MHELCGDDDAAGHGDGGRRERLAKGAYGIESGQAIGYERILGQLCFMQRQGDSIMVADTSSHMNPTPEWVLSCFDNPDLGVQLFLKELCSISGATYAHIRARSRYGRFYSMVESIGPYKQIGWNRRFHLLDHKDNRTLADTYMDYGSSRECQLLEQKYLADSAMYQYLHSLRFGLWVPLICGDVDFGYVTLSWTEGQPEDRKAWAVKAFMDSVNQFIPLLFSACRSIMVDDNLARLWKASGVILSSPTEALCYDCVAAACTELWGPDSATWIGQLDLASSTIDIIAAKGKRIEGLQHNYRMALLPAGTDIFNYTFYAERPVVSFSLADEKRFDCSAIRSDSSQMGSLIATKLSSSADGAPIAVIVVGHALDNYFDSDDLRYLAGIAQIGYEALAAHRSSSLRVRREIDTLFTRMLHDVAEPLQALVADADVLKYQSNLLASACHPENISETLNEMAGRAANILDTGLALNGAVSKYLDAGIDGAATRVIVGRVNLYRLLNSLVDLWEDRAANQGVEIRPLFDSLRGVEVACDETGLTSALGHLLGNAIKYSFWGRRQSLGSSPKFRRYVSIVGRIGIGTASIEFQNYGIGILQTEIGLVKEEFYRGELARREGRAGTGRGLWSANLFFKGMGGGIDISSEYKGSDPMSEEGPYFTTVKAYMPYSLPERS